MKRIMIWLMIATLLAGTVGLTGCSDDEPVNTETVQGESGSAGGSDSANSKESKESKGLFMQVDKATADDRIRFVIQTGGTTFWHNGDMDEDMNH